MIVRSGDRDLVARPDTAVSTRCPRLEIAILGWLSANLSTPTILAKSHHPAWHDPARHDPARHDPADHLQINLPSPYSSQNLRRRHHLIYAVSLGSEPVVVEPQGPFVPRWEVGHQASRCRCFARFGSSEIRN